MSRSHSVNHVPELHKTPHQRRLSVEFFSTVFTLITESVELMDIKQVLFATGCFLHANQILVVHNPHSHASGIDLASTRPHLVVGICARNVIEEIKGTRVAR
jgi:hypothetical protein